MVSEGSLQNFLQGFESPHYLKPNNERKMSQFERTELPDSRHVINMTSTGKTLTYGNAPNLIGYHLESLKDGTAKYRKNF